jgi:hypothetical protein
MKFCLLNRLVRLYTVEECQKVRHSMTAITANDTSQSLRGLVLNFDFKSIHKATYALEVCRVRSMDVKWNGSGNTAHRRAAFPQKTVTKRSQPRWHIWWPVSMWTRSTNVNIYRLVVTVVSIQTKWHVKMDCQACTAQGRVNIGETSNEIFALLGRYAV